MTLQLVLAITSALFLPFVTYRVTGMLFNHTSIRSVLSSSPLIGSLQPGMSIMRGEAKHTAVVVLALSITAGLVAFIGLFPWNRSWGIYGTILLITVPAIWLAVKIGGIYRLPGCDGVLKQIDDKPYLITIE